MSSIARLAVLFVAIGALLALPPAPVAAQEPVDVSLIDFQVVAAPTSVTEGPVSFQVSNDGVVAHNLVVVRTDLAPDALPVDEDTYLVDESQLNVVASSVQLLSGETAEVTVNLAPGNYVLICNNLPTHYQAGMYLGFQVTAAPAPTATAPAQDGTTTQPDGAITSAPPTTPGPPPITAGPSTGYGPAETASSSPWAIALLAAAGAALLGLGFSAFLRARQQR